MDGRREAAGALIRDWKSHLYEFLGVSRPRMRGFGVKCQ